MNRVFLLFVFTRLLLIPGVGCSQKLDTPDEFRELAHRHEREGNPAKAIEAYRKALELDPEGAITWYDLGVAHVQLDQPDEALAAYTKAIELDSSIAPAFNNRATVYAQREQFDRAIDDFTRAIELNPQDAMAWHNRGIARHDLGQHDAAQSDLDESIRLDGRDPSAYIDRGNVYLRRQQWKRALEDFDNARHLDDSLPQAWLQRATALAGLGRTAEARASAERAQALGADISDFRPARADAADAPEVIAFGDSTTNRITSVVTDWLAQREIAVLPADSPWDLTASGENPVYYLIREASRADGALQIQFSKTDFDNLAAHPGVRTDLVVVAKAAATEGATPSTKWHVVSVIENWEPDFEQLEPQAWSLTVDQVSSGDSDDSTEPSPSR